MSRSVQLEFLSAQIADAIGKGAKLVYGGKRVGGKGYFMEPAVLVEPPAWYGSIELGVLKPHVTDRSGPPPPASLDWTVAPKVMAGYLLPKGRGNLELTYRVLPQMLARGHGGIINVASVAAFQPVGYMGAYAASKAYVLHFSEALWAEARERGVTITTLCPGTTRTEFFNISGVPGWLERHSAQEVKPVVRSALKALEKRRQYVVSGWKNYILTLLVRVATPATVWHCRRTRP